MIKLIIFDLDGVLIDAKNIHFEALNLALTEINKKYVISWDDHLNKFDGLKTNQKLLILSEERGLPVEAHEQVWSKKQKLTISLLENIKPSDVILNTIRQLKNEGYYLACCSNSIKQTIITSLNKLKVLDYFDLILSNEDVKNSKPHPEIYWTAISKFSVLPHETLIIEDSPYGLLSADRTNSNILRVKTPKDVNYENIFNAMKNIKDKNTIPKWVDKKMTVLIPMAGAGSRFEQAGYLNPKPLINVNNKPMIKVVVDNLNIDANYIFVVQKKHRVKYNLDDLLNVIVPGCKIIETDGLTEGAACTTLLAKQYINNNDPLFFANSDQFVEWNSNEFMYLMNEGDYDGGIVTFKANHPKWSYAKVNENGLVTEVAEKNPISDNATVGFYYWKRGSDFVKYAENMISKNIRVNNEFYVCPVFNEAITDGKKIKTFNIKKMWGLGTPDDLIHFLEHNKQ